MIAILLHPFLQPFYVMFVIASWMAWNDPKWSAHEVEA